MNGDTRAYVWMLLGAASFASMGAMAGLLRRDLGWPVIALGRAAVPLALFGLAAVVSGVRLRWRGPRALWVRSLAGSVSMLCMFYSLTRLPVSVVFTLANLYPLWVALLSWPLLGQAPGRGVWACAVVGVVGVVLVQRPFLAAGDHTCWAALAVSVLTAVVMVALHRLSEVDVRAVVFHFSLVSLGVCLLALTLAGPAGGGAVRSGPPTALTLLVLGGMGLAAASGQLFMTLAFASGPPARVSVVGLTQVRFAVLYDLLLWGRSFEPASIVGIALVIAPTAWLVWTGRGSLGDVGMAEGLSEVETS
jgi:drug/metabolite transporter (DMT)-like permease